jgi:hypothetical protein
MADDKVAGGPTSTSDTQDWEKRNTDPTIPFDGALPENIPGPISNVQLELAAEKRSAAHLRGVKEGSDRLRPEHAKQAAKTGDAITDSDANVKPSAGLNVAEDAGADERNKADSDKADDGKTTPPQGRRSAPSGKQTA